MKQEKVQEVTLEECPEEQLDLAKYELVLCDRYERFVLVVVREKQTPCKSQ